MRSTSLVLAALAIPALLGAQAPTAAAPEPRPTSVMFSFETFADRYGSFLVAAFDSIPASKYSYRPTPVQQSIGYIAQHLEGANYDLCALLGGPKPPTSAKDSLSDSVKATWPKDTLVSRLRASLRFCDEALARLGKVEDASRASVLLAYETDLAEHYSQLASYMRLLGLVPPSALPPVKRVAIDLPVSALAPYVGTYEIAPSFELEVTMRDSGLIGKTTLGGPRRLRPMSPTAFFAEGVDADLTFVRDARGTVTGVVLRQFGRDRKARKIR